MLRVNEGKLRGEADVLTGNYVQSWVNQINHADFYTQMTNINSCRGGTRQSNGSALTTVSSTLTQKQCGYK